MDAPAHGARREVDHHDAAADVHARVDARRQLAAAGGNVLRDDAVEGAVEEVRHRRHELVDAVAVNVRERRRREDVRVDVEEVGRLAVVADGVELVGAPALCASSSP